MQEVEADNIPLGIFWMVCTMFVFVSMDAIVKYLMQVYPVIQVVWGRFFFHMIVLCALFRLSMPGLLRSAKPTLQWGRSLLMVITTFFFFTGLSQSTLATATTMMFLSPIYTTVLSIPLLGEKVGARRWFGVLAGFAGAMIIMRPGGESLGGANLFLLAAPFTHAFYQIMTREARSHDQERVSLVYAALAGALLTTAFMPFTWKAPQLSHWWLFVLAGALGCIGHFCLIRAFKVAPASAVTPFSYTSLIWATLYGYILFRSLPDPYTLLGAAIIVSSGIYIFYRERQLEASH